MNTEKGLAFRKNFISSFVGAVYTTVVHFGFACDSADLLVLLLKLAAHVDCHVFEVSDQRSDLKKRVNRTVAKNIDLLYF